MFSQSVGNEFYDEVRVSTPWYRVALGKQIFPLVRTEQKVHRMFA